MAATDIAVIKEQIRQLSEMLERHCISLEAHIDKEEQRMDRFMERMEENYAKKWVEKVISFVFATGG